MSRSGFERCFSKAFCSELESSSVTRKSYVMEVFNLKFVKEVEKHPELYNYTLPEYSRKDFTDKAWNEIAEEVNLSAAECKEKWRNLRSTFVKNLKLKPSSRGVTKKKPYYLMDAMKFATPFVRVTGTSTGNISEVRHPSPTPDVSEMDIPGDETSFSTDNFSEPDVSAADQQQSPSSPSVQRPTPTVTPSVPSPCVTPESSSASQRDRVTPDHLDRETRDLRNLPTGKRKVSNYQSDNDFNEYFSEKTANISNTSIPKDKREAGIYNFLISLIPDLVQMNDVQLRIYKRKALLLVDEVTETSPEILYRDNRSMVPSYQSTAGLIINPNQFSQSSSIVTAPTENNFSLSTGPTEKSKTILPDIPERSSSVGTSVDVCHQTSSSSTHLPYSDSSNGVKIKQEPDEDTDSKYEHSLPIIKQSVSLPPCTSTLDSNFGTSLVHPHPSSPPSLIHLSSSQPPSCKKIKQETDQDSYSSSENPLPSIKHSFSLTPIETPPSAVCSTSIGERSSFQIRIELLGKNWVEKMKTLKPDQRIYAEKLINDVLFEAELGRLKHGCHVKNCD